jgi:GR25 family glycosyltransferase involved in LPS biosynthesis
MKYRKDLFIIYVLIILTVVLVLAIGLSAILSKSTSNPTKQEPTSPGKKGMEGFDEKKEYINGIDIIYWINLDRSPERRIEMEKIFKNPEFKKIKNRRFPAIDGKNMDVFTYVESEHKENPKMSNTEYACLISHLETVRTFSESGHKVALIMEDDMTLDLKPYWTKSIQEIMDEAPEDWEVIQLCYISVNGVDNLYDGYHSSTGAYLINQKGAKKLLEIREKERKIYQINKHTTAPYLHADFFIYSYLKTYCYKYPMFVYKDNNDSLIHPDHLKEHEKSRQIIIDMYQNMKD